MNIGDKVRLVHEKEEGIVYRFLTGNVVEVEIEDGFRIQVLQKELVLISPLEGERLLRNEKKEKVPALVQSRSVAAFSQKGIFLSFIPVNDRELTVQLINNTDWVLPFIAYKEQEGVQTGLAAGTLEPRTNRKLTEVLMKEFEQWPTFDIQALYFKEGKGEIKLPFQKRMKCRAQSFYKRKQVTPVLNKEGYVYQLDEEGTVLPVATAPLSAAEIRERMLSPQETQHTPVKLEKPQPIIDLHIEMLNKDHGSMAKAEKLELQLKTFEQKLENAIAAGLDEITFIHGAGNGVLRDMLHRRLGKHQHVQYFKDAQKEKFGYGATLIKIK